jgi:hypothetical protein
VKIKLSIVAICMIAVGLPTYAAPLVFNFTPASNTPLGLSQSFSTGGVSITAYGYSGGVVSGSVAADALYENHLDGLGLCNPPGSTCTASTAATSTDIQYNEFVRMDFSLVAGQLAALHETFSGIQFTLDIVQANAANLSWHIFGANSAPAIGSTLASVAPVLLQQGPLSANGSSTPPGTTGTLNSNVFTTLYNDYFIAVDCPPTGNYGGLDITSLSLTYTQVPEPGTFIMSGMALLAVGAFLKRIAPKG